MKDEEKPRREREESEMPAERPDAPLTYDVPLPPDQKPVAPIQDPPAPHEKAPIDEGPKGPKKIA